MTYETIRFEQDERSIATVTLARADKHNALNARMIAELRHAADTIAGDPEIRAVVLAAEGKSFCAGGDLRWMEEQAGKDRAGRKEEALALAHMLGAWDTLPKLVIARVQGPAYGGGIGLICVSDVAIAARGVQFALTETRLGLIPATIGPFVVQRLGGMVRQVFLHARAFDTEFALRVGMLAGVAPPESLDEAIEAELAAALQCAPGAVAQAKALCRRLAGTDPITMVGITAEALADRWESAEAQAGIAAFFSKTPPPWR